MANKLYEETNILAIADAIRTKNGSTDTYKVADMPQAILDIESGSGGIISPKNSHVDENGVWHKPDEWPDIESIEIPEGESRVYLLYANHLTGFNFCSLVVLGSGLSYSIGTIVNGEYVASSTPTSTASTTVYITYDLNDLEDEYSIVEIKGTTITRCSTFAYDLGKNSSGTSIQLSSTLNTCLMRYGRMPKGTNIQFQCNYIESDNILDFASNLTNTSLVLANAYYGNYNMCRWRNTGWNISNNYTTSLTSFFLDCRQLIDINTDFSGWCSSKTTNLNSVFLNTYSIKDELDLSNWNTSKVTTVNSMFSSAINIPSIKGLDSFDLSSCTYTGYMFSATRLLHIDLDCSNWKLGTTKITNASNMFNNSGFSSIKMDNSIFNGTVLNNMFYTMPYCKLITFNNCSFSNITSFNGMFYNCYALLEITLTNFDFSSINVASAFLYFLYGCYNLKKIQTDSCTSTTGKTIADTSSAYGSIFNTCYTLLYLDASFLDMSSFSGTYTHSSGFTGLTCLSEFIPPTNIRKNFSIKDSQLLSHDSLIRIFNNLSTVTTATTLTINSLCWLRLTDEEIAIATDKGWTLSPAV